MMDDPDLVAFMEAGAAGNPMPNIPEMNGGTGRPGATPWNW